MDPRVRQVRRLIDADLRRPLDLARLARSVDLSASRLRHLFKAEVGQTPARYLKSRRMRRLKELVEGTFLGVRQIMLKVGIRDESHFVRDFKRIYGLPPVRHRMRHSDTQRL